MRITLSLDDDLARHLEAWRSENSLNLSEAVHTLLRRGLCEEARAKTAGPFRTKPIDLGDCLVPSLDNVWEVLDNLEKDRALTR